jgi:hypothetical protein
MGGLSVRELLTVATLFFTANCHKPKPPVCCNGPLSPAKYSTVLDLPQSGKYPYTFTLAYRRNGLPMFYNSVMLYVGVIFSFSIPNIFVKVCHFVGLW